MSCRHKNGAWRCFFKLVQNLSNMLTKKEVLESLNSLPKELEAEDAIEKIILLEKIHIGLAQSDAGNVVTLENAKARLKKWL